MYGFDGCGKGKVVPVVLVADEGRAAGLFAVAQQTLTCDAKPIQSIGHATNSGIVISNVSQFSSLG